MLHRAEERIRLSNISLKKISIHQNENEDFLSNEPGIFLCNCSYDEIAPLLNKHKKQPELILLDLGVSFYHLKEAQRGFSYTDDTLDMRFNPKQGHSALEIVNYYSQKELVRIFQEYGQEPYSRRVAKAIVGERPFSSAVRLADCIRKSVPAFKNKQKKIHPATRVFQALRITVNTELSILQTALEELPKTLAPGGILIVISFHSLEDRIAKQCFKEIGVLKDKKKAMDADFLILTRHPIRPSEEEIKDNPASRSARMRVLFAQRGT